MNINRSISLEFYILLFLLLAPTQMLANDIKPDLSGSWQLNQAMSDDPKEAFKNARKKMRKQGRKGMGDEMRSAGWPSGDGPGGKGKREGRGGFGERMKKGRGAFGDDKNSSKMQGVLIAETLDITLTETEITFVVDANDAQVFLIDGRGTPLDENMTVVLAGWEGDQMVVEKTSGGSRKRFERYTVSPDGSQLHVAVSIEQSISQKPIKILRIFDRIDVQNTSSD